MLKELRRLAAYAKSSANLLAKLILEDQRDSYRWEVGNNTRHIQLFVYRCRCIFNYHDVFPGLLQCLFRTPLSNYNAIVLLHRDRLPYPQRLLFPSEVNQGILCSSLCLFVKSILMSLVGSLLNYFFLNCWEGGKNQI